MSAMYWFRVSLMILALAGVVFAIRYTRVTTGVDPLRRLRAPPVGPTFNFCPTRIAWLELTGSLRLEEIDRKWMKTDKAKAGSAPTSVPAPVPVELDPIAVEKWISRFCSTLTKDTPASGAKFATALTVGYVTGTLQTLLKQDAGNVFKLQRGDGSGGGNSGGGGDSVEAKGFTFISPDLAEALRTLPNLPPAPQPGT